MQSRINKALDHFEEYISIFGLIVMTTIAFMNVLSRKLLGMSWSFTEEITTNLFILISLLGAAIAVKKGSHLGLNLLYERVSNRYRRLITIITTFVAAFFSLSLLIYGIEMVYSEILSGQLTPALGWPEWIFGSFVPLGALLIFIRVIQTGVVQYKQDKHSEVL